MKTHHRVGSIFWLIIGLYILITSYRLGIGRFQQPGPGFIFFLSGLLLTTLSAIDVGRTLTQKAKTDDEKKIPLWRGVRWQKVLLVFVGMSVYVYGFDFLGSLLSIFLLMFFLFKAVEPTPWWTATISSLITTLACYLLFQVWLKVPFPTGILGF
jgi:hypothetical protein